MHPFAITDELVNDTLCTALEGGITYWATNAEPTTWPEGCEYASDVLTKGASVTITIDPELIGDDANDQGTYTLNLAAMKRAIRWFCKARKITPAQLEDDCADAADADAIVQYALFGEVVFA